MRSELDHCLDDLHTSLSGQASVALSALREASASIGGGARQSVEPLQGVEALLFERYRGIERDIEVLLARQAPVACDLRRVLALLRINHHLERIGHHAVRVGCSLQEANAIRDSAMTTALLRRMADSAVDIATQATRAIQTIDHDAADTLRHLDTQIDTLEDAVAESAMDEFRGDERGHDQVLWSLRAARRLERIGDHAIGIALRVRDLPLQMPPVRGPFISVEL